MKCQFDVLCSCISDKKVQECLDRVPVGLDETYIRILTRLRTDHSIDIDMIKKMFLWLVHSLRPLKLIELAEAITLNESQDRMDFSAIATDPADVLRFSGGLVTTTDDGNIVGLAHFSIKEFLLSDRIQRSPVHEFYAGAGEVQLELTRICLNYIMMNDFCDGQCYSMKQLVSRTSKYSFLSYSAHYWVEHYHSLPGSYSESLHEVLLRFFTAPEYAQNMLAWQQIKGLSFWRQKCEIEPVESPIFNAAHYGMTGLVEAMCQMGYSVNEQGSHEDKYPILTACYHQKNGPSMIAALIAAGANINVCNHWGNLAYNGLLHEPDNWGFLQDLIRQGLDVRLQLNVIAGHPSDPTQMAGFLLDNGADIDKYENALGTPLQCACLKGNLNVMRLLLDRGAGINYGPGRLGTPLHAAIIGRHENIVRLLLKRGVDVNIEGGVLGSPLQAAAWHGDQSLAQELLLRGSDVNNSGGCYGSALAAAVAQRNSEVTKLLFTYDADPNPGHERCVFTLGELRSLACDFSPKATFHTHQPIIWAIEQNDIELVRELIERGASLNSMQERCPASLKLLYDPDRPAKGFHPFCCAIYLGFGNIAEFLIARGADPHGGNSCGAIVAAKRGNIQVFRDLLYASPLLTNRMVILIDAINVCKDKTTIQSLIDLINNNGILPSVDLIEPLMKDAIRENFRLKVNWLLEKGVSPNTDIRDFGYVLPFAVGEGNIDIARDLMVSGADVNLGDMRWGTPLFAAFRWKNIDFMRELLRRGADVDASLWFSWDYCYKLLHRVAGAGDIDVMSLLLEYHVDVMSHCELCETALWRAVETEDVNMIRLLVHNGANLNQCNTYGKPILRWAEENHLELACGALRSLGAVRHQQHPEERIDKSVRRLCQELSTKLRTDRWPKWLSFRRWMMLGRCLYLGGDKQNAMIALEQTVKWRKRRDYEPGEGEYLQSKVLCEICKARWRGRFHLCKDHDIMGICEKGCLSAHERELQIEGKLETHESLTYPRPWFSSAIPKDHVALSEGHYILRETWLESLEGWTVSKEAAASLPYRRGSSE